VSSKRKKVLAEGAMALGHKIALDPTPRQAEMLARAAGCSRFTWNWALAEWKSEVDIGHQPTVARLKKRFNEIKADKFAWIYESPKDANQQPFADLLQGIRDYEDSRDGTRKGAKVGFPTWKKRGQHDSFYVSNDKFHFYPYNMVCLPVIGDVALCESPRLHGKILGARIHREADRWFISVYVQGEFRRPTVSTFDIAGVDLGLTKAAVSSTGRKFSAPKPLRSMLRRLRRKNRDLHRKKKGSKNRQKEALRLARLHKRIHDIREDFLQKVTTLLCRENQAMVLEDLNVAGMLRNHRLARALSDVGLGRFRELAKRKGPLYDCLVILADRWFPSTLRCCRCGHLKKEMPLKERVYHCEKCGLVMDRDENASNNLALYPWLTEKKTPAIETLLHSGISRPWFGVPGDPGVGPPPDCPSTRRAPGAEQGRSVTQEATVSPCAHV